MTLILFIVDEKLHRGYRDQGGRFTLEQCNLSKANRADNLVELADGETVPENAIRCEHCF